MAEKIIEYIINPDVVLREEDQDGALLFNPDTNDVKVLNTTGLFIWKLCQKKSQKLSAIVKALKDSFDKVPVDEAETQVKDFIKQMESTGFIGTIEQKK